MKTFKGKINGVEYTDVNAFQKALIEAQDGDNLEVSYETKACDCNECNCGKCDNENNKDNEEANNYSDYLKKANKIFTDLFGPNFSSSFSKYLFGNSDLKDAFEGKSKTEVKETVPQKESDTYEITTRPAFDLMTLMKAFNNIDINGYDKLQKECNEAVKKFEAICNTDTKACNWNKFASSCEDAYNKFNAQWDDETDKIDDLQSEINKLNDQIDELCQKVSEKEKTIAKHKNLVNKIEVVLDALEELDQIGKDYIQKVRTKEL